MKTREQLIEDAANFEMQNMKLREEIGSLQKRLATINDAWAQMAFQLSALVLAADKYLAIEKKLREAEKQCHC